ncbi:MAG: T9SS type A sorting domain-containing protein [Lentimicrobium sp.]|nr:T9SS type A sorting domain-containing protein [Lentimicrobium sp.]
MRKCIITLLTVFYTVGSFCQVNVPNEGTKPIFHKGSMERVTQQGFQFPDYPPLSLPGRCRNIELPPVVDNSSQPYLRPVFSQQGASCGQSASVGYNFCYEINRLRNLPSDTGTNLYPDHFVYNFMNATTPYYGMGVSYFHTFDILYDAGNPNENLYGPIELDDTYYWMNGYDGYLQAMHNRISGVSSIHAGTPEGLLILKHWLHNHLNGSAVGGVANYYAGMSDLHQLAPGTPEQYKFVQIEFQEDASHALTIVGYNDSIRFDVNGDGMYTNHIDITGDGIVDMQDWEIGGLKFVNSYGNYWANEGFCYMLYRTLALKYGQGGIWNNSTHVLHADTAYRPLLTIKATLQHNKRGQIRLLAGISSDTTRLYPEHTLEFSIFNYQGGDNYMAGNKLPSGKTLEFGLDITPLLSFMKQGSSCRIFLITDEQDPNNTGNGALLNYSVINYQNNQTTTFTSNDTPLSIVNNGRTIASVVCTSAEEPVTIRPQGPVIVNPETPSAVQFTASGGHPPYQWQLKHIYYEKDSIAAYTLPSGVIQTPTNPTLGYAAIPLPFSFPFYGKTYDTLYMHVNGYLMFERQDMPYYYLLFDKLYLRQLQAIAGYMNKDMGLNTSEDYISVTSSTEKVIFNWRISASEGNGFATFSTTITPEGEITFHYGTAIAEPSLAPVIGISNGTRTETLYSQFSERMPNEGQIIQFSPSHLPAGMELSESGLLQIPAGNGLLADVVAITATDSKRLQAGENILITTGPEVEIRLTDSTAVLSPGAMVPLSVNIKNHSQANIDNLLFNLTAASANTAVAGHEVEVALLPSGAETTINNVFSLIIPDTISCTQLLRLQGQLKNNTFSLLKFVDFHAAVPEIVVSPPCIRDSANLIADPGEEVKICFNIYNYGYASAGNLSAKINISDPYAAINGATTIETGELKSFSCVTASYTLTVSDAAPNGHVLTGTLDVYQENNLVKTEAFSITLGEVSMLVVDLDKNHNSAVHMVAALNALNLTPDLTETIDTSILNYDLAFLSLGFFTQNHTLTVGEDSLMVQFLNQGGNLYLEGGAFFKQDPPTLLRSRLRVQGSNLAWSKPADTLQGLAGTPAEGFQIEYLGDWKRGENLIALEPAVPWFRDKNSGLDFVVALDSGYYHALSSTIEFGGTFMFDSPGRPQLMERYLQFLQFNTHPLSATFRPEATNICSGASIGFEAVYTGNPTSFQWTFEGGSPESWDGPSPRIQYQNPGVYAVSLTVQNETSTNTFTLDKLITVDHCIGIEEVLHNRFRLYPNPASDNICLEFMTEKPQTAEISILDLQGRTIFSTQALARVQKTTLPVKQLHPGMYVVKIDGGNWSGTSKLIIQ